MVNRLFFSSLCKTFLAVCLLFTAPCPANPQIVANAPAQPATARASFGAPAGGPVAWERAQAESLGMRFVNIPVLGWSAPDNAKVAQFLKLVQQDPTQKIFIHCYYGEDRTGVMVATYRIAQQNWTSDQAAAEMNSFGFHYHLYPAMKSYVRAFPAKFAADPVFAPLHASPPTALTP